MCRSPPPRPQPRLMQGPSGLEHEASLASLPRQGHQPTHPTATASQCPCLTGERCFCPKGDSGVCPRGPGREVGQRNAPCACNSEQGHPPGLPRPQGPGDQEA